MDQENPWGSRHPFPSRSSGCLPFAVGSVVPFHRHTLTGRGLVRAPGWYGFALAAFHGVDQGRQPVRRVQRRRFARQHVIAQGAQYHRQISEQLLGGRVLLAGAVGTGQDHTGGDKVNVCGAALEWTSGGR